MSNILIIADGKISPEFIKTLEKKSLNQHKYTVIVKDENLIIDDLKNFEFIALDATSLYRLKSVCQADKYKTLFIIVEDMREAKVIYKNIRTFNKKIRVVALDLEDTLKKLHDSYLNIIDLKTIITNRLYDFLPDVPVTAQTVGLNEGEVMEVSIPFSSTFAFRYVGSISQVKWRIVAIYREEKLILPTNATMLRPRDRILIVGKPQILTTIYKKIKSSLNIFPEPFGKNFYLYLDINKDANRAVEYMQEAIYLLDKFVNKCLIVRVVNPNNFEVVNQLKSLEKENIRCYISYLDIDESVISSDITEHEIGLILLSGDSLRSNTFNKELYEYKKLVYIFGDTKILNINEVTVVKSDNRELEEISSVVFYIAETLHTKLSLREYDPEGKFESSKHFIEHYEILAHTHNTTLNIIQKKKNPIKAIKNAKNILLVVPFRKDLDTNSIFAFFKRDVDSLLLRTNKHPKLLITVEE